MTGSAIVNVQSVLIMPPGSCPDAGRGFDYAALPADTSALARSSAEKIKTMARRMISDIVGIGNTLQAVKEKLDLGQITAAAPRCADDPA